MAKQVKVDIDGRLNIILKPSGATFQKFNLGHPQFETFEMVGQDYEKLTRAVTEHNTTLGNANQAGVVVEEET